jgi:hypothetical protein
VLLRGGIVKTWDGMGGEGFINVPLISSTELAGEKQTPWEFSNFAVNYEENGTLWVYFALKLFFDKNMFNLGVKIG